MRKFRASNPPVWTGYYLVFWTEDEYNNPISVFDDPAHRAKFVKGKGWESSVHVGWAGFYQPKAAPELERLSKAFTHGRNNILPETLANLWLVRARNAAAPKREQPVNARNVFVAYSMQKRFARIAPEPSPLPSILKTFDACDQEAYDDAIGRLSTKQRRRAMQLVADVFDERLKTLSFQE